MDVVRRATDLLLKPKETWPRIDAEPATTASVFNPYVLLLAAIPAIAAFIGMSLIGVGGFGFGFRVPILAGLTGMVVGYVLSLAGVYLLSLVIDVLAPTFGGHRSSLNALKVAAYASTAAFVGGVFSLLPALSILGLLAALYSGYLLYLGLPVLMKTPQEKALPYAAVVIAVALVLGALLGAATSRLYGGSGAMLGSRDLTIRTPDGEVRVDPAAIEEFGRRIEEAGKQVEAARSPAEAGAAAAGAALGTGGSTLGAKELQALLPESTLGLSRQSIEAQELGPMSNAQASYSSADGSRQLDLMLTDATGIGGIASVAVWANVTVDRDTGTGVEKVYRQGDRTIREDYEKDGSRSEYTVILPNGVVAAATGVGIDIEGVKQAVNALDLGRMAAAAPQPAQR